MERARAHVLKINVDPAIRQESEGLRNLAAKAFISNVLRSAPSEAAKLEAQQISLTMEQQDGPMRLRRKVRFVQPLSEEEVYKNDRQRHLVLHSVVEVGKGHAALEADAALSELATCEHVCQSGDTTAKLQVAVKSGAEELVRLVEKAHGSLQFYERQVSALKEGVSEWECSVCLERSSDPSKLVILPCSHIFHADCAWQVLQQIPHCPECRCNVKTCEMRSAVMELKPPEQRNGKSSTPKHGSKLCAVIRRLRQICSDPEAKVLVFLQWAMLESKVAAALNEQGMPFLRLPLKGKAGHAGQVFRQFQEGKEARVLILSLDSAAAGSNLTAANHVMFVHPMNAETVEVAKAYERQALGRVRRIGQKKDVHVWRFVTKDTVEEHIWKLHMGWHRGGLNVDHFTAGGKGNIIATMDWRE